MPRWPMQTRNPLKTRRDMVVTKYHSVTFQLQLPAYALPIQRTYGRSVKFERSDEIERNVAFRAPAGLVGKSFSYRWIEARP